MNESYEAEAKSRLLSLEDSPVSERKRYRYSFPIPYGKVREIYKREIPKKVEKSFGNFEFPEPVGAPVEGVGTLANEWLRQLPQDAQEHYEKSGNINLMFNLETHDQTKQIPPTYERDGRFVYTISLNTNSVGISDKRYSDTLDKNAYLPPQILSLISEAIEHQLLNRRGSPDYLSALIDVRIQTPKAWREQGNMVPHVDGGERDSYLWSSLLPTESIIGSLTLEEYGAITEEGPDGMINVSKIAEHPELASKVAIASMLPKQLYCVPTKHWLHAVPRSIADPEFGIDENEPRIFMRIIMTNR